MDRHSFFTTDLLAATILSLAIFSPGDFSDEAEELFNELPTSARSDEYVSSCLKSFVNKRSKRRFGLAQPYLGYYFSEKDGLQLTKEYFLNRHRIYGSQKYYLEHEGYEYYGQILIT